MPQDVPDARWVVRHTSHTLDHLSRTFQRPQIVGVAVGFGAFDQLDFDPRELFATQLRQSSGPSGRAQSVSTGPPPRAAPIRHNLMAHTQLTRDLGWTDTLLEQVRRTHPPFFHRREVASRPNSPRGRLDHWLLYRNDGHVPVLHGSLSLR